MIRDEAHTMDNRTLLRIAAMMVAADQRVRRTRRWWRMDIPLRPLRTRWRRSKMCACFRCQGFGCGLPAAGGKCVLKTGHDGGCVFYT